MQNATSDLPNPQSVGDLEFLLGAMNALGTKHSITKHFTAQLELEISATGLAKEETMFTCHAKLTEEGDITTPRIPMSGLLHGRAGKPMTVDEITHHASMSAKFKSQSIASAKASPGSSSADSADPVHDANNFQQSTDQIRMELESENFLNVPGLLEPAARRVSSFPSMTPMLHHIKLPFSGPDSNSKPVPDSIPNPNKFPTDNWPAISAYPKSLPLRNSDPTYQNPQAASAEWSQPQPQPPPQHNAQSQPAQEPPEFHFVNPSWFSQESLNDQPPDSDLDAMLVGAEWDVSSPQI